MNNTAKEKYSSTDQYPPGQATKFQKDDLGAPLDNSITNDEEQDINRKLTNEENGRDEKNSANDSNIDPIDADDDYPDDDNDTVEDLDNENDLDDEDDFQEDDIDDPDDDPDDTRPINPSQF